FDDLLDVTQQVFLDLIHRAALDADQMVMEMGSAFLPQIKTGNPVSKVDFVNDFQFGQQLQCPIYCRQPDFGRFILDEQIDILCAEMVFLMLQQYSDCGFALGRQFVFSIVELLFYAFNPAFHETPPSNCPYYINLFGWLQEFQLFNNNHYNMIIIFNYQAI